ncbi:MULTISPECIES: AAA family ATPase [Nocardiopsidaceae]|uniref:ATP-binding protein n=1 Tax=Streptomonospora nanhaiensis TaxID=1323731 RepID=A0ABY6YNN1_9ACTN|nr:ATP-binding protein [Streptomonospora nanhaiensis]WAE73994.1 ATP-binding protein [Streptomonospora nanhaiensis]
MLLSFRVENHKSIRDEQQLLLTPVYDDARPEKAGWEASTVAGIFGANASGKSNILDSLSLMRDTVRWSMRDNEPGAGMRRHPFALGGARGEPTTFVVDLEADGVRYTYGFAIDDRRVTEEWLYSYPKQRKRVVFEREGSDFEFGEHAPGKLRQVAEITGENVLFLTVAARASNEVVDPVYRWFSDRLVFAAERLPGRPLWLRRGGVPEDALNALSDLLRSADTGIRSVELREEEPIDLLDRALSRQQGTRDTSTERIFRELLKARLAQDGDVEPQGRRPRRDLPPTPVFNHGGTAPDRPLRWEEESRGTRALAALGFEAQRVLERGGVLVVDEIDASLHPYLSARVISLFQDEEQNPAGAQLVFTSHDAALLGRVRGAEVLKRDHIWFVDKDGEGRTSLYPLSDFKPRGDDNRARRYLTGRYGAVPDVDDELFREALARRERHPAEDGEGAARR